MSDRRDRRGRREPVPLADAVADLTRSLGLPGAGTARALDDAVAEAVGPDLADHVEVATLRDGTLVLAVRDPAVASRIRWDANRLRDHLAHALGAGVVTEVKVVVRASR